MTEEVQREEKVFLSHKPHFCFFSFGIFSNRILVCWLYPGQMQKENAKGNQYIKSYTIIIIWIQVSQFQLKPNHRKIFFIISSSFLVKVSAQLGGNVTLPCRLASSDSASLNFRIHWIKVSDDESLTEDVLLSMGFHVKSYGSFEGRVFMQESDSEDASLIMTEVSMSDMGKYQCEILNGIEETLQEVILEVEGGLTDGKSCLLLFPCNFRDGQEVTSWKEWVFFSTNHKMHLRMY